MPLSRRHPRRGSFFLPGGWSMADQRPLSFPSSPSFPALTTGGASLAGRWEADSVGLADGTPVSTWPDQSGNARDLTGTTTTRPTSYTKRWPQGRQAVSFASASTTRVHAATASDWTFLSNGTAWSLWLVWRTLDGSPSGTYTLLDTGGSSTGTVGLCVKWNATGSQLEVTLTNGSVANVDLTSNGMAVRSIHNVCLTFDGTTLTAYDWGTSLGTAAKSGSLSASAPAYALTLGCDGSPANPLNGEVAALVVVNGAAVNAADRNAVNAYLECKWHPAGNANAESFLDSQQVYASSGLQRAAVLPTKYNGNGGPIYDSSYTGLTWDTDKGWLMAVLQFGPTDYRAWCGVYDGAASDFAGTTYATSTDGTTFTKPNLGQVTFAGNTSNNLIIGPGDYGTSLCYDTTLGANPYLLSTELVGNVGDIGLYDSADGITGWTLINTLPSGAAGGGTLMRRADGRYCLLVEGANGSGYRTVELRIADTTSPAGSWTDFGLVLDAADTHTQWYRAWPQDVGGGQWAVPLVRFDSFSAGSAWLTLWTTRDEGFTWQEVQDPWVIRSNYTPAGWDWQGMWAAQFLRQGDIWRVYYTGDDKNHGATDQRSQVGLATLGYRRLVSCRPTQPQFVQASTPSYAGSNVSSQTTGNMPAAVTTGNTLFLVYWSAQSSGTPPAITGVTDTAGNTGWAQVGYGNGGSGATNNGVEVWKCDNATGGSSFNATASLSPTSAGTLTLVEVSGLASGAARSVGTAGSGYPSSAAPHTGSLTPHAGDFLLATFGGVNKAVPPPPPPAGFLDVANNMDTGANQDGGDIVWGLATATGAIGPTWGAGLTGTNFFAGLGLAQASAAPASATLTTRAVYAPGKSLTVNADCSGSGCSMTAALLDEQGNVISGFGDAQSTVITSDTTGTVISWGGNLLPLRTVRVRFTLAGGGGSSPAPVLYSYEIG